MSGSITEGLGDTEPDAELASVMSYSRYSSKSISDEEVGRERNREERRRSEVIENGRPRNPTSGARITSRRNAAA